MFHALPRKAAADSSGHYLALLYCSCRVGKIITRFMCRCSSLKTWIADIIKLHNCPIPAFFLYRIWDKVYEKCWSSAKHITHSYFCVPWTQMDRWSQAIVASGAPSCRQLWDSSFKGHSFGSWMTVPKAATFCLRHTTGNPAGPVRPEGAVWT